MLATRTRARKGELRSHEKSTNQGWKVRRYWLDEVARVMPDWQKEEARRTRTNRRNWGGFKASTSLADDATAEDYELLGVPRDPPPSAKAIGAAFRAVAMTSHPDRQQVSSLLQRLGEKRRAGSGLQRHVIHTAIDTAYAPVPCRRG